MQFTVLICKNHTIRVFSMNVKSVFCNFKDICLFENYICHKENSLVAHPVAKCNG